MIAVPTSNQASDSIDQVHTATFSNLYWEEHAFKLSHRRLEVSKDNNKNYLDSNSAAKSIFHSIIARLEAVSIMWPSK